MARLLELDVVVDGRPLQKFSHQRSVYVAAPEHGNFALHFRNKSSSRILSVSTVDGLSIMNGEPGSVHGKGYVIEPYASFEVPGWRLDNKNVAEFVFGKPEESYARKAGTSVELGIIGVAVFTEKRHKRHPDVIATTKQNFQSRDDGPIKVSSGPSLGTSFGDEQAHHVTDTTFDRKSQEPEEIVAIRYETYDKLVAMGIIRNDPMPFPADHLT